MKKLNKVLVFSICSLLLCTSFINIYANINNDYVDINKDMSMYNNLLLNKDSLAKFSSKIENVYGTLDKNGTIKKIYVVNEFNVLSNGVIYDYGRYSKVIPLSDKMSVNIKDSINKINASNGKLYYQGDLVDTNLPWEINIKYFLDKKEILPDDLAGKSGKLKVVTEIRKNKDVDNNFYNNYLLQITFSLDSNNCTNIVANTSTVANAGKTKKINFTSMPGKDSTFELTADIKDFEMTGISFSGIPFNINIDLPDINMIKSKLIMLSTSILQLDEGAKNLKDGSSKLNNSIYSLSDGSSNINDGMKSLSLGMLNIKDGSTQIYQALKQFESGIEVFKNNFNSDLFLQLTKGLEDIVLALNQLEEKLDLLQNSYNKSYELLDNSISNIPTQLISENQLKSLIKSNNNKNFELLISYYSAGVEVKKIYNYVKPSFKSIKENLPILAKSLGDISLGIKNIINEINNNVSENNVSDSNILYENINKLVIQYELFNNSISSFSSYINNTQTSYNNFDLAISELSKGYKIFDNNISKFSFGLNELKTNTNNLPEQMEKEFSSISNSTNKNDYKPISFVSNKNNKKIKFVQFLFKTESIKKVIDEDNKIVNEDNKTLLERFLELFSN